MRVALAVAACALCVAAAPPARAAGPRAGGARTSRFTIPASARELIVVWSPTDAPAGSIATLRAYLRAGSTSPWRPAAGPWRAETGYGHLRDVRREGDGSTPTGVFTFEPTMYGNAPNPGGLHYAYHHLVCGDWWDEDPLTAQYNRLVHVACGVTPAFAPGSEALWTETVAYPYFAVLSFNMHPIVAGPDAPGSAIFLHSWVGGATAGCVALPRTQLLALLRWLAPAAHPVIEIGTDREIGPVPPPPTASAASLSRPGAR